MSVDHILVISYGQISSYMMLTPDLSLDSYVQIINYMMLPPDLNLDSYDQISNYIMLSRPRAYVSSCHAAPPPTLALIAMAKLVVI